MNGKAFTILNPRSFFGSFSDYGCYNTEGSVSLTDNDVQTLLEGVENQNAKKKPKVTYVVALIVAFFNWKICYWSISAVYLIDFLCR